ncbi:hypothetical protein COCNU_01G018500 [Cocos nucifera]|uniref:Spen paralogue and orthologue SPOC C-terminal domain-containing protein n=1 Tax=Cocos nucifera TaxID=13894 RepID=A0A8K0HWR6_COCNU|nr:hypothetical protein COCNU_01G018500 [Cocos nucifera]
MVDVLWYRSPHISAISIYKKNMSDNKQNLGVSGEKAQDINWSEIIEIKGKVRLQAFEKFIQELPRSRNRALMVISLCWKVGTSRAGLTGMKEVAKIYRESERVGFAQICPGFDLYVCPRSDTIITILAKSGFFKGMAAVEEDQDSLIGCVVWRRSHPSLSSAPKKLDKKKISMQEHHLLSPDSSIAEVNSPPRSEARSAAENATLMANESHIMQLSNNLSNSGSLKTKCGPGTAPSIPYNSPLIPAQPLHPQKPDSRSLQEAMRCNENSKNSLEPMPMPSARPGPQQLFTEVPPRNIQPVNTPCNLHSIHSDPRPIQHQVAQKSDSSSQKDSNAISSQAGTCIIPLPESQKPVLGSEVKQIALPGPPPLPPEVLQRLISCSRAVLKEPNEGTAKAEIPLGHVAEPNQAATNIDPRVPALPIRPPWLSTALNRTPGTDVDDDLPEFDFNSACGVPETSASRYLQPDHHMQDVPSFNNKQLPIEMASNAGRDKLRELPSVKPRGSMRISPSSSFPGEPLGSYQGITLPAKFESFVSENKTTAQTSELLMQPCILDANKDSVSPSSNCRFLRKNHWDDDDDMPEWCPSDLEHLNQPPPSSTTKLPSLVLKPTSEIAVPHPSLNVPTSASLCPPEGQGFCPGFELGILGPCPASNNPAAAPVQTRPTTKFVHSRRRPPLIPNTDHSLRPWTRKFGIKPPQSNSGWRSRRP